MKKYFKDTGIISVCYAALGLILLIWPGLSTRLICMVLGGALAIYGISRMVWYFAADHYSGLLRQDLSGGILALLAGAFLLLRPETVASLLPILFGIILIVGAAGKLQMGLDLKRMEAAYWGWTLLGAGVCALLGAVLLLNPFQSALLLVRFIGLSLILDGALNFGFGMAVSRAMKEFYRDDLDQ